jgi:hypothetical protein
MEIDEGIDQLSSSVSSSSSLSSSISYLLEKARQMIANYPNEEELTGMIAENYINYITELSKNEPPVILSPSISSQGQQVR